MANIDYQKSAELRKKYHHRRKHCYNNMYRLFIKGEIDRYYIGLLEVEKVLIRHAWAIKEEKIIDTSLGNFDGVIAYHPMHEINKTNIIELMNATSSNAFFELDDYQQIKEIEAKCKKYALGMIGY